MVVSTTPSVSLRKVVSTSGVAMMKASAELATYSATIRERREPESRN
jgi:hypothetical protein